MRVNKFISIILIVGLLWLTTTSQIALASELKIATWNIEHLRQDNGKGSVKRVDEDYEKLAEFAKDLDADVIALQEVEGQEAASRVFDKTDYDFYFSKRRNVQNTGFAVREGLTVTHHPDVTSLNVTGGLRHGVDITVGDGVHEIRLLAVHLKSGCFVKFDPRDRDCEKLEQQVPELEKWIDARATEGIPFAVLGDFNHRFNSPGNSFWSEIDDGMPINSDLTKVTEGRISDCLDGRYPEYIDHIVLDKQSTQWLKPDSFEQILFKKRDLDEYKLSDHCPISVVLNPKKEA
ncbi:MAG: endonuclease/exonuclease/phosphatase family protein [Crocosphaera sp.]